jgi:CheY-like chemotaxis protein
MDINLPGISGYDATKAIRKFNRDLPIISQTAYAISGDRKRSMEAGCNDYISKPIKKEDLLEKLEKFLFKD